MSKQFKLFTDGGSRGNPGKSAIAFFLFDENDFLIHFDGKFIGVATNNIAEYEALFLGLSYCKKNKIKNLICHLDSELVVKQILGSYSVKNIELKKIFVNILELIRDFEEIKFIHIKRELNHFSDKLVNTILDNISTNLD